RHISRVIIYKILGLKKTPIAFEALWDADKKGWFLELGIVVEIDDHHEKNYSILLYLLSFKNDISMYESKNRFHKESIYAKLIGEVISKKFNIPFWFPSPEEATDECPHWYEQDKAIKCGNCGKLFLHRSPYLPDDICSICFIKRERGRK
ncbi:MAG: hypothetical protein KDK36_21015, partial [Leptospiraceae bacterium]|nr:hypothetical protein [Leptospiraceae bacterium]